MEKQRRPRLRLVEPTCAVSKGGTRMSVQGLWFKGPPTLLTIHLTIPLVNKTVDIPATFGTETHLSFILPDVTSMIKASLAEAWISLALTDCSSCGTTTTKTTDAPQLRIVLYPELTTKKVFPMHLPLSATSDAKISLVLNHRFSLSYIQSSPELPTSAADDSPLPHLTSLPVFARISYVSDKTHAPIQVIRTATWNNAASALNGDVMLEFDPPRAA
ncbi:hypothetical protein DYB30_009608, partial [Aphanomyces astaci]